jgi:hypothetical protein
MTADDADFILQKFVDIVFYFITTKVYAVFPPHAQGYVKDTSLGSI